MFGPPGTNFGPVRTKICGPWEQFVSTAPGTKFWTLLGSIFEPLGQVLDLLYCLFVNMCICLVWSGLVWSGEMSQLRTDTPTIHWKVEQYSASAESAIYIWEVECYLMQVLRESVLQSSRLWPSAPPEMQS